MADIDAKFSRDVYDSAGNGIPLGTSKNENNTSQTFSTVSLGTYATLSTLNRWEDILDYNNNGKSLGQRQNVNIVYRIRQGLCYATVSIRGEGPKGSKTYFDTLSEKAKVEAERVTAKMESLVELCGIDVKSNPSDTPYNSWQTAPSADIDEQPSVENPTEKVNPQVESFYRWLSECASRPLPQTRE